ncbi:unnamed protein product [Mytilus coruscus]|uniref:Uncharacterized protein n=1 Tax=Mytilus coruscus TaxID=42192 RepID=A0A6J8E6B3_MYTCO|nr:unnamed protein product [Mytilus coruscus]
MGIISSGVLNRTITISNKCLKQQKMGNWSRVWGILGTPSRPLKPYLTNLIPEDRRWGLLQQAVWWNNHVAIRTLFQFQACDKTLMVKKGISEKGPTGAFVAKQIAALFGYLEAAKIIKDHINPRREEGIQTFYDGNSSIENEEYGLQTYIGGCAPSGNIEVKFVIDNSGDSQWKPLNIKDYAYYKEKERVSPAGGQFLIKRRYTELGVPTIQLKLLGHE